jgi:hypothetical protein
MDTIDFRVSGTIHCAIQLYNGIQEIYLGSLPHHLSSITLGLSENDKCILYRIGQWIQGGVNRYVH